MFSPIVFPVTVIQPKSRISFLASSLNTADIPPAAYNFSIWTSDAGANLQRSGVLDDKSFIISKFISTFASFAIAVIWSTLLVEHPSAISAFNAFIILLSLIISLGLMSFFKTSITAIPAFLASLNLSEYTAGIVPLPGNAIPNTSHKQFIELAVNIPEHEPHVGHAEFSNSHSSFSSIVPFSYEPTASNIVVREISLPLCLPASIGPPLTKTAGILTLSAAITIPGTILSQLGIKTNASNAWAFAIHSIESAISSLVTKEYFIPSCPIAIPSQTPIAGITIGVPPATNIPFLTASVILSRFICPGIISFWADTTPIIGLFISSSVNPSALSSDLCAAFPGPNFIASLFISLYSPLTIFLQTKSPISVVPTLVFPSLIISPVL